MSKTNELFEKAAVLVPKTSGFDLSYESLFSAKCGELVPVFVKETLPNDVWSLGLMANISLPPLATDFYGRVDINLEAFFVPYRLCYGGWEEFITIPRLQHHNSGPNESDFRNPVDNVISNKLVSNGNVNPGTSSTFPNGAASVTNNQAGKDSTGGTANRSMNEANKLIIPDPMTPTNYASTVYNTLPKGLVAISSNLAPGSLMDMLGMKVKPTGGNVFNVYNILPIVAYHKIWEDYYRSSFYENKAFIKRSFADAAPNAAEYFKNMPNLRATTYLSVPLDGGTVATSDGASPLAYRKRKWADDYFTTCTPTPHGTNGGTDVTVLTGLGTNTGHDSSGNNVNFQTGFTIPMLRAANTLQMFLERANVAGWKYRDAIRAQWGVTPPDCCETSIYLGRYKTPIYNNTITMNNVVNEDSVVDSNNPFGQYLGSKTAAPSAGGSGSLFNNFHCKEHGVIMVLFSLTPHAYYATGTSRMLNRKNAYDFADPLLQNVGTQAVYAWELCDCGNSPAAADFKKVFGYTMPYCEWGTSMDEVHGLFRDGSSLNSMALTRSFAAGSTPLINATFTEIPTDAMDNVCQVNARVSNFGCYGQIYWNCKAIRPLQKFIIPTLGTPEFMRTQLVSKGGTKISG